MKRPSAEMAGKMPPIDTSDPVALLISVVSPVCRSRTKMPGRVSVASSTTPDVNTMNRPSAFDKAPKLLGVVSWLPSLATLARAVLPGQVGVAVTMKTEPMAFDPPVASAAR